MKEAAPIVTSSLTFIINLSIVNGIVPEEWEYARVSPVFRDGVKADPNNYRPTSVLPVVSKLIERVVFNQFYGYLNENNLLTESQSGFRPRFSTEATLLEETNEWIKNIDKSLLNGVIFLDLKKLLTPWTILFSSRNVSFTELGLRRWHGLNHILLVENRKL